MKPGVPHLDIRGAETFPIADLVPVQSSNQRA